MLSFTQIWIHRQLRCRYSMKSPSSYLIDQRKEESYAKRVSGILHIFFSIESDHSCIGARTYISSSLEKRSSTQPSVQLIAWRVLSLVKVNIIGVKWSDEACHLDTFRWSSLRRRTSDQPSCDPSSRLWKLVASHLTDELLSIEGKVFCWHSLLLES